MARTLRIVDDRPVVRMMVLETDQPHPDTQDEKGSYSDILHKHFEKAGKHHDPPLGIETDSRFVVTEKGGKIPPFEDFNDFHAVLITGSMYDAHGDNQWILDLMHLIRDLWVRRPDIKFSGICFGHQLLSRLLGAEVSPHPAEEWELAHSRIDLAEVGQRLFRTDKDHLTLHQMHQDHVATTPTVESSKGLLAPGTNVHVWGSSGHTAIQGLYIRDRLFTSQAHVGFDSDMVKHEMDMRVKDGAIQDKDQVNEAEETASFEHDGEVVARAILRFFYGEDEGIE
ncbi:class I glutamine amidotransferase-like protein [Coniochaeta ligniaria NRRL 30616]|uniref:Class I glutamine amidotransferase-like protein n=1 Tax=Coniochaeta ligniaria NRRL 30616 TaxID=1408157 RepID=A0A1J7IZR3_9PEZI|nr:class I glutamine amidotransferase-like protein [Coniochaeta ligniaria NRRL 30616]